MSTASQRSRPGHELGMLVGSDGTAAYCSCSWIGPKRTAVQASYADQILHMDQAESEIASLNLLQSLPESAKLSDMTSDQLVLAVGLDAAARLMVLRSRMQAAEPLPEPARLVTTDAIGDATDLFCEQHESYIGSDTIPALEVAAQHRAEFPDHEVLFLEPAEPRFTCFNCNFTTDSKGAAVVHCNVTEHSVEEAH